MHSYILLQSSAVYSYNDLHDREANRLHPVKKHRPLASGAVSPNQDLIIAFFLLIATALFWLFLPSSKIFCLGFYFILQVAIH
ncbi:MAG: UbiA family prenyltransferase [Chthoniobacterales bacterium]|nr:UbiA family prenyltransferase [Chthoniobacterales bacterium]